MVNRLLLKLFGMALRSYQMLRSAMFALFKSQRDERLIEIRFQASLAPEERHGSLFQTAQSTEAKGAL